MENRYRACIVQEVTILFKIMYSVPSLSILFVFYLRQTKNSKWFASEHVGWPKAASQGPGCPLNVASPDFDPRERLGVFFYFYFYYIPEFAVVL